VTIGATQLAVFGLALFVLGTVGGMKVVAKAGYPAWLAALFAIPGVDLVILMVIAFSKWPVQRRLEQVQRVPATAGANWAAAPEPAGAALGTSWGWSPAFRRSWDPIKAGR